MDELSFLPATEQARLVREVEVSPFELVETYLERIERLDPELGAFVTVCGEQALADARAKADAPAESPFHGVRSRSRTSTRRPGSARRSPASRLRRMSPTSTSRTSPGHARPASWSSARRIRRVRHDGLHRLAAERPLPNAMGPRQERGWLERRRGGSRRGRARSDRAGLGRRRLDPDPGLVLRALRDQGITRPRLERAVRPGHRARHGRADCTDDAGRRCVPRPRHRLRVGRPVPGRATGAAVRGGDRRRARPAPGRLHDRGADRRRPSILRASPLPETPPSCSPRSGTRSRRPRPTGAARS